MNEPVVQPLDYATPNVKTPLARAGRVGVICTWSAVGMLILIYTAPADTDNIPDWILQVYGGLCLVLLVTGFIASLVSKMRQPGRKCTTVSAIVSGVVLALCIFCFVGLVTGHAT